MHLWKRIMFLRTEEDCYSGSRIRITVSVTTPDKRTLIGKLIIIISFDRNTVFKFDVSIYWQQQQHIQFRPKIFIYLEEGEGTN